MYEHIYETPYKNGDSFKLFTTDRGSRFIMDRITIAYHQPNHLRNLISHYKLKETPTMNLNSVLQEFTKAQDNNHG